MDKTDAQNPFYDVHDVAAMLGRSNETVYRMIRRREIPVVSISGVLRVPRGAFERWLADREQEALDSVQPARPAA